MTFQPDNAGLVAGFGTALAKAKDATEKLVGYLSREGRAAYVWRNPEEAKADLVTPSPQQPMTLQESLALATEIINAFWYADGQQPKTVRICPGIIAVGEEGVALAKSMNSARNALKASLVAMDGHMEHCGTDLAGNPILRPLREVAQEAHQAARLQHQQATRSIITLEHMPVYAGFTWANCRKVQQVSIGDIRRKITSRVNAHEPDTRLLLDLKTLLDMPDNEIVAWVRPGILTPRVNVQYVDARSGEPVRKAFHSVLPILYLGEEFPEKFSPLTPRPLLPRERKAREKGVVLHDKSFLLTFAAYRYLVPRMEKKTSASSNRSG